MCGGGGRGEAREGRESDVAYRQELAHFIHDHMRARTHKHTVHVYILEWVCPHVQEGEGLALQRGGEEVVTHQLTAQTAHVHSIGGACVIKYCMYAHAHMHT